MQNWMLIQNSQTVTGDSSLFDHWAQEQGGFLWVDIEGAAEDAERRLLAETLELPQAEVRDALRDPNICRRSGRITPVVCVRLYRRTKQRVTGAKNGVRYEF